MVRAGLLPRPSRQMRPKHILAASAVLAALTFLTGCGGKSTNVDVVLVDRSMSFCELIPNCANKISANVDDKLSELAKQGGSLRLLLIGNDTGAPVQASSNDHCTGLLRGAAACFVKPSLWNKIVGKSGTQQEAALAKIKTDVTAGIAAGRKLTGTSIFDAITAAQHYLDDRRLPQGERQLVILSDMIEDSKTGVPPLTCAHVGAPGQNRRLINQLRDQGRLPDLQYMEVEVLGATARKQLNASCRERFWRAYFSRAGADLLVYEGL
jgi:hypothetical protein